MSSHDISFTTEKPQSMWGTGNATLLEFHEYFPLIGGGVTDWAVKDLELSGAGSASAKDGIITYDPGEAFDNLKSGATRTVTLTYRLQAKGEESLERSIDIEIIGTGKGPMVIDPRSGERTKGAIEFEGAAIEDKLADPHVFDTMTPIDIDWDLVGDLRERLQDALGDAEAHAEEQRALMADAQKVFDDLKADEEALRKLIPLVAKYEGYEVLIAAAQAEQEVAEFVDHALEDLHAEQASLIAIHAAKVAEKAAADLAFGAAQTALHAANSAAHAAGSAVDAAFGALGWIARKLGLDGVDRALREAKEAADRAFHDAEHALEHAEATVHHAQEQVEIAAQHVEEIADRIAKAAVHAAEAAELAGEEAVVHLREKQAELVAEANALLNPDDAPEHRAALQAELHDLYHEPDHLLRNAVNSLAVRFNAAPEQPLNLTSADLPVLQAVLGYTPNISAGNWATLNNEWWPKYVPFIHALEDKLAPNYHRISAIESRLSAAHDGLHALSLDLLKDQAEKLLVDIAAAGETLNPVRLASIAADALKDKAAEFLLHGLDGSELQATGQIKIDADIQAGLQVDFVLDGGSVEAELDYKLDMETRTDRTTGDVTFDPTLLSQVTGKSVAFTTASPHLEFSANILYDIGAKLHAELKLLAEIAGTTLLDLSDDGAPFVYDHEFRLAHSFAIFDFDSRDYAEPTEIALPEPFDFIVPSYSFPFIETEGRAADVSVRLYRDAAAFNPEQLAKELLDLVNSRLDYSEAFKTFLRSHGQSDELAVDNLVDALEAVVTNIIDLLTSVNDDGELPIFVLSPPEDAGEDKPLIHIDTFTDPADRKGFDINKIGKFGFFVSSGESEDVARIDVDVDQLIAVIVNEALGNESSEIFNPLHLEISLEDLLGDNPDEDEDGEGGGDNAGGGDEPADGEPDPDEEEEEPEIESPLTLEASVDFLDIGVGAGVNVTQDFALSVDDMVFSVKLEGGKTTYSFNATDGQMTFREGSFRDMNGDGDIDYTILLVPEAQLFNDTEIALHLDYAIKLLSASAKLGLDLPLEHVAAILPFDIPTSFELNLGLGPILELTGDIEAVTADLFERMFDYAAGSTTVTGSFKALGLKLAGSGDNDKHVGGSFDDKANGRGGNDRLVGNGGDDLLSGGAGRDKLYGGADEDNLIGGGGADLLNGGTGEDKLNGGTGNDRLIGGSFDDVLRAGSGDDFLFGNAGNDLMDGGSGNDTMNGGSGVDTFLVGGNLGADVITDFGVGDKIRIMQGADSLDDITLTRSGDNILLKINATTIVVQGVTAADLAGDILF